MPKLKNPYTFPHKSRKAKVDYITDTRGYYGHGTRYAIEFNVSAGSADISADALWANKDVLSDYGILDTPEHRALFDQQYAEVSQYLWDWALEDAQNGLPLSGSRYGCDTYRYLWDGTEVSPEFALEGRGGKHLCLVSVGRIDLRRSPEELAEYLMEQTLPNGETETSRDTLCKGAEWTVSTQELDLLYRYIRQCEVDFTPKAAAREVEYQAAWRVASRVGEELEAEAARNKAALAAKRQKRIENRAFNRNPHPDRTYPVTSSVRVTTRNGSRVVTVPGGPPQAKRFADRLYRKFLHHGSTGILIATQPPLAMHWLIPGAK